MARINIEILIEKAEDGTYSAYNDDYPAFGMGDTAREAYVDAVIGFDNYMKENPVEAKKLEEKGFFVFTKYSL